MGPPAARARRTADGTTGWAGVGAAAGRLWCLRAWRRWLRDFEMFARMALIR